MTEQEMRDRIKEIDEEREKLRKKRMNMKNIFVTKNRKENMKNVRSSLVNASC